MEMNAVKIPTSRSGFDMSTKLLFSSKAGELLPVFCQEMIPSNKKRIKLNWFSRSKPVNTAAFTRLREYYDFYFVPYAQLWKQWKMFALQMDINSIYASDINNGQSISDLHPYFTTKQVADFVYNLKNNASHPSYVTNIFGYDRATLACKLLEYLGYGDYTKYIDSPWYTPSSNPEIDPKTSDDFVNVPLNPFPLLAYQKIYQDKYRDSQWEKSSPNTYNLDYITGNGDCQIPVGSIDTGNMCTMFDLQYANWNKDYYMGLQPNTQFGEEAVVPLSSVGTAFPQFEFYDKYLVEDNDPSEVPLSDGSQVRNFNSLRTTGTPTIRSDSYAIGVTNNGTNTKFRLAHSGTDMSRLAQALQIALNDLSILTLRQYEMLQRYKEVQQSHDTDYKEQIEALFGVSLSWKDSNQVRWLGGVARNYDIGEVVNTNITGDAPADIAGKGISVGDGYVDFDCDGEYGILMCIYHCKPILDYSLGAPLKLNTKYKFSDYAQPAFDRIGMQEIPLLELFNSPSMIETVRKAVGVPLDGSDDSDLMKCILGYGPRYLDYKTSIDRVVGVFRTTEKSWVTPVGDDFWKSTFLFSPRDGHSQLPTVSSDVYLNYAVKKVNPAILDPIFAVAVDSGNEEMVGTDSSVNTDQFLCNVYFEVSDVKNLDYDGMPY